MGRQPKYNTPEERRIAANAKSKRSYHKATTTPSNVKRIVKVHQDTPEQKEARHVGFYCRMVEGVARQLKAIVGDSPTAFIESIYKQYLDASNDFQLVFEKALEPFSTLSATIYRYQGELLRLVGVGKEWTRAEEVLKEIKTMLTNIEDVFCMALEDPAMLVEAHANKNLAYQHL
ncbi:hypothetical protein C0992_000486 [Termitomyces sp. T32_za158]|nr:hypothetical protein C0992_000486 [Termitomyces sp. T32_za158]